MNQTLRGFYWTSKGDFYIHLEQLKKKSLHLSSVKKWGINARSYIQWPGWPS